MKSFLKQWRNINFDIMKISKIQEKKSAKIIWDLHDAVCGTHLKSITLINFIFNFIKVNSVLFVKFISNYRLWNPAPTIKNIWFTITIEWTSKPSSLSYLCLVRTSMSNIENRFQCRILKENIFPLHRQSMQRWKFKKPV